MFGKLKWRFCLLFQIIVFCNFLPFMRANVAANISTLVSIVTYSRHGQRTPASYYPKDTLNIQWPVGRAQLLNNGKELHFKLGQYIRKRYKGFLPDKYSEKDILIKASEQDRVMMSAAATLAGLYPPVEEQIWNEDLLWQPIPIYHLPEYYCYTILLSSCKKVSQIWNSYKKSSKLFQSKDSQLMYQYLKENAGFWESYDEILNTYYIWDTLLIQDENNYTLPEWTKEVYPQQLKQFFFEILNGFHYKDFIRMTMGGFFNEMMNHFKSFQNIQKSDRYLMKMFFAHDANINQILYAINNWKDHIVEYGATVIFELHEINKQYYVQVYYLKNLNSNIELLEIEKGLTNYPLMKLDKMFSRHYVNNEDLWKEECQSHRNSSTNFSFTIIYIFIPIYLLLLLNKFS